MIRSVLVVLLAVVAVTARPPGEKPPGYTPDLESGLFSNLDTNSNGIIGKSDHSEYKAEYVLYIINQVASKDGNDDDLTREEFVGSMLLKTLSKTRKRKTKRFIIDWNAVFRSIAKAAVAAFDNLDTNGDGKLDLERLWSDLENHLGYQDEELYPTLNSLARSVMQYRFADGIDFGEFLQFLSDLQLPAGY